MKSKSAERRLVAPDENALAPIPVDFAVMNVTPDTVTHSLYQTRLRPSVEIPDVIDAALVGRFQYGPSHFKQLTMLVMRQFILFEATLGRKPQESAAFLKAEIAKTVAMTAGKRANGQPAS